MLRYNIDGSLDSSFGNSGVILTPGYHPESIDIIHQPDGKFVLIGQPRFSDAFLVRYNSDGSIDTGFGDDGFTLIEEPGNNTDPRFILQPDGKIVSVMFETGKIHVKRLNPDGSLDTETFGPAN